MNSSNRSPRGAHRRISRSSARRQAKGDWREGTWTIEFARKLNTEHVDDDVAFSIGGTYAFVVSCYEIAGAKPMLEWFQPLYRCGDAFDRLVLKIIP